MTNLRALLTAACLLQATNIWAAPNPVAGHPVYAQETGNFLGNFFNNLGNYVQNVLNQAGNDIEGLHRHMSSKVFSAVGDFRHGISFDGNRHGFYGNTGFTGGVVIDKGPEVVYEKRPPPPYRKEYSQHHTVDVTKNYVKPVHYVGTKSGSFGLNVGVPLVNVNVQKTSSVYKDHDDKYEIEEPKVYAVKDKVYAQDEENFGHHGGFGFGGGFLIGGHKASSYDNPPVQEHKKTAIVKKVPVVYESEFEEVETKPQKVHVVEDTYDGDNIQSGIGLSAGFSGSVHTEVEKFPAVVYESAFENVQSKPEKAHAVEGVYHDDNAQAGIKLSAGIKGVEKDVLKKETVEAPVVYGSTIKEFERIPEKVPIIKEVDDSANAQTGIGFSAGFTGGLHGGLIKEVEKEPELLIDIRRKHHVSTVVKNDNDGNQEETVHKYIPETNYKKVSVLVDAPFTSVGVHKEFGGAASVSVKAPFTQVETSKGGSFRVEAPFTSVVRKGFNIEGGGGGFLSILAPFTKILTGSFGGSKAVDVRAPFTSVQTLNEGGKKSVRVRAPFVDIQTGPGGVRIKAPFVDLHFPPKRYY